MKKAILILAILLATSVGLFAQTYKLYVQNGEIKTTTSGGTIITQIKGTAIGAYNLNSLQKIVVTSPSGNVLITIDRTLVTLYNGSATIPPNSTILTNIGTVASSFSPATAATAFAQKKVTTDTTIALTIGSSAPWGLQGVWASNTGTATTITLQTTIDGTNWVNYYGTLSSTLTTTAGSFYFEDFIATGTSMRLNIDIEAATTFYLTLWKNFK